MKTIRGINVIECVNDFLNDTKQSQAFYTMQGEKESDFINEPDRAARCYDAASDGCSGSTHSEVIDDFREFGDDLLRDQWRAIEHQMETDDASPEEYEQAEQLFIECETAFNADCDKLEAWHEENGSLHQQVG
jgi:hypothetical protein